MSTAMAVGSTGTGSLWAEDVEGRARWVVRHADCMHCPLAVAGSGYHGCVPGEPPYRVPRSDEPRPLLFAGEAPGATEHATKVPFTGKAGREYAQYMKIAGLERARCHVTNLIKCHPPGDRDPGERELACCGGVLIREIREIDPDIVVTMGRHSTRFLLGDYDMEQVHGMPFAVTVAGRVRTVVPVYHPAAGMHNTRLMKHVLADFRALGDVVRGSLLPGSIADAHPDPVYGELASEGKAAAVLKGAPVVAIDTESVYDRQAAQPPTLVRRMVPWCMSLCVEPGRAFVVMAGSPAMNAVAAKLADPHTLTLIHNAMYDLPIMSQLGVRVARYHDTMVKAYLLQIEQGLKALAFRIAGMAMRSYEEMVRDPGIGAAYDYLTQAAAMEWPIPAPVLEFNSKTGEPHVRKPQPMATKIKRIIADWTKWVGACADLGDGDGNGEPGLDLAARWHKIPRDEGRAQVEAALGLMPLGDLSMVAPRSEAIRYSARDADATFRIDPWLQERMRTLWLTDVMDVDHAIMPLVIRMMERGVLIDKAVFQSLDVEFSSKMAVLGERIREAAGHYVNPGSSDQVSALLFDELRLHEVLAQNGAQLPRGKRRKGDRGKEGEARAKRHPSTDTHVMDALRPLHPVVSMLDDWKGYQKLLTSYVRTVPEKADPAGRVHTNFRITNTVTGRLSSHDPNLMAQPVRDEEGRRIRGAYVAAPGHLLLDIDYSQIEMRVVAHDSQDPVMMGIFQRGEDIHSETAVRMFRVAISELDEMKHRYPAKRVGFGILNLITAEGLLRELIAGGATGFTLEDCQLMIDTWFDIYSGIANWIDRKKAEARRYGYVRDMWMRIREAPELVSSQRATVEEGLRQSVNAPIQSGAQGIIKRAMAALVPEVERLNRAHPLLQVHDELLFECDYAVLDECVCTFPSIMEQAVVLTVPVIAEPKLGRNWAGMVKLPKLLKWARERGMQWGPGAPILPLFEAWERHAQRQPH